MENLNQNAAFIEKIEAMSEFSLEMSKACFESGDTLSQKVALLLTAMSGQIGTLAFLVSKDQNRHPSEANMLFACMLAALGLAATKDGIALDINPAIWSDAVDMVQTLHPGLKPEDFLAPFVTRAVDAMRNDTVIPFDVFMKARGEKGRDLPNNTL